MNRYTYHVQWITFYITVLSLGLPLTADAHAHGRMYYTLNMYNTPCIGIHTSLHNTWVCDVCSHMSEIMEPWVLHRFPSRLIIMCPCFYFEIIIINDDDKDVRHIMVYFHWPHTQYIWVIFWQSISCSWTHVIRINGF